MAEDSPPKRILLVEGVDDKHVVLNLLSRHPEMPEFDIRELEGFDRLKDAIGPEIKVSARTALGILADADADPKGRWNAIADRLSKAGVNPGQQIARTGAIVGHQPRVGVWLMPDNLAPGQLEDFIQRLIPKGDPVWPRARRYIDGIPAADRKFTSKKVLRAQVHAWLATRKEPRKMGAAIGIGDLDATVTPAVEFIGWLRHLFG